MDYVHRHYAGNTRTRRGASLLYAFLGCIICWGIGYHAAGQNPEGGAPAGAFAWDYLRRTFLPGNSAYLLGGLFVATGAFMIHRFNNLFSLIRVKTYLPALFYLLLCCTEPDFTFSQPVFIGVLCLILALYRLFTAYHNPDELGKAFDTALLFGAGSLVWTPLLWFLPLFWYGMYKFRALTARSVLASLTGVAAVYWLVAGWCAWQADYTMLMQLRQAFLPEGYSSIMERQATDWLSLGYATFLTLFAILNARLHGQEDNLRTRQYLAFTMTLWSYAFLLFLLPFPGSEGFQVILYAASSILMGHFFTLVKGRAMYYFLHFSIFLFFLFFILRIWNF